MSPPNDPPDTGADVERPRLDVFQLAAGALAATTAAVIGSRLGVNGTIVGAAVGSVVGTVGSATYAHYLRRTATRVRTVVVRTPGTRPSRPSDPTTVMGTVPGGAAVPTQMQTAPGDTAVPTQPAVSDETLAAASATATSPADGTTRRWPAWRWVLLGVAATFVLSLAVLTVFELLAGRSVSSLTGGSPDGGGTTITEVLRPEPAPLPSETPLPPRPTETAEATPTLSPTATTASPTPTGSPPTPTPTPSTPTPTPTAPTATTTRPAAP